MTNIWNKQVCLESVGNTLQLDASSWHTTDGPVKAVSFWQVLDPLTLIAIIILHMLKKLLLTSGYSQLLFNL